MSEKIFVVLANLGGVNNKKEVRRFLFNLFNDKYIIPLPKLPRYLLANLISFFRYKKSTKEYEKMGGFSPILQNTQLQKDLLKKALGNKFEIVIAMSYSQPFMKDALLQIPSNAKKVILLPLYPQYSTTTTKSSAAQFCKTANALNIQNIDVIPNFYQNKNYIKSCAGKIEEQIAKTQDTSKEMVILFSAHGIPKSCVEKFKDPYQTHVNETAKLIASNLQKKHKFQYKICFQSRVGPKEWLKPYIQNVLPTLSGKNVIVFPVAFVSEHLETLVELDIEYQELAQECGIAQYLRAGTPSNCPLFIEALKEEVIKRV